MPIPDLVQTLARGGVFHAGETSLGGRRVFHRQCKVLRMYALNEQLGPLDAAFPAEC